MSLNALSGRICLCVLSILLRSTVRPPLVSTSCFPLLDNAAGYDNAAPGYPPYNIERTGDNTYRISVAVAGFAENEITVVAKENALTIKRREADRNRREQQTQCSLSGQRRPHQQSVPASSPSMWR